MNLNKSFPYKQALTVLFKMSNPNSIIRIMTATILMLSPILVGIDKEASAQQYYRNHDGKLMTDDQFYERVKHCAVLIFTGQLNMNEANCDKWVLTFEGESRIVEKIFTESELWKGMKEGKYLKD